MLMLMLVSNSSSQHIKEFFCLPRFRGHNRRSFNATGTASKIRQYQKVAVSHTRAAKSTTLQRTWRKTKTGMRDREKEQIELRQNKEEHMGGELTRHRWVQLATCVSNQPRHGGGTRDKGEEGTQRSNRGDTNTWAAECFTENCSTTWAGSPDDFRSQPDIWTVGKKTEVSEKVHWSTKLFTGPDTETKRISAQDRGRGHTLDSSPL